MKEGPEFLDDRVRFHYHLTMPYGKPDVDDFIDVLYDSIPTLPENPKQLGYGIAYGFPNSQEVDIFVEKAGRTITFVFYSHPEKSSGPQEEHILGPFLKL